MPEANRPDPRRKKAPASRPGKPRRVSARREIRGAELRAPKEIAAPTGDPGLVEDSGDGTGSIRQSIVASAEQAAEQRFGSAARRAAILAALVCVLTLTIAGPVRTYFSQRTEMKQLQASEAQLREQIAELEEQKAKYADPVFIAAQARERLGFVMPGEIPYQVQLPPGATQPEASPEELAEAKSNDPWYTTLWHTIADAPHGISPAPPPPAGVPGAPEPVVPPRG